MISGMAVKRKKEVAGYLATMILRKGPFHPFVRSEMSMICRLDVRLYLALEKRIRKYRIWIDPKHVG